MIDAIREAAPDPARAETISHINSAFEWLIDERARIDARTEDAASDPKDVP